MRVKGIGLLCNITTLKYNGVNSSGNPTPLRIEILITFAGNKLKITKELISRKGCHENKLRISFFLNEKKNKQTENTAIRS